MHYDEWRASFQSSEDAAKSAFDEIAHLRAQVKQLQLSAWSAFGDGFYEGYLEYAKDCKNPDYIDFALEKSEKAESNSIYDKENKSSIRLTEIRVQARREGYLQGCADYGNKLIIAKDEECAKFYAKSADEYANRLMGSDEP